MAWLTRALFRLTLGLAGLLLLLVAVAPLLDDPQAHPAGWARLPALFARDAAVRRTSLASAAGLAVTAWVFFRPPARTFALPRKVKRSRRPPPPTGAGA